MSTNGSTESADGMLYALVEWSGKSTEESASPRRRLVEHVAWTLWCYQWDEAEAMRCVEHVARSASMDAPTARHYVREATDEAYWRLLRDVRHEARRIAAMMGA